MTRTKKREMTKRTTEKMTIVKMYVVTRVTDMTVVATEIEIEIVDDMDAMVVAMTIGVDVTDVPHHTDDGIVTGIDVLLIKIRVRNTSHSCLSEFEDTI